MIEILVSGLPDMALTHRNGGSQVLDRWLSSARNIQEWSIGKQKNSLVVEKDIGGWVKF